MKRSAGSTGGGQDLGCLSALLALVQGLEYDIQVPVLACCFVLLGHGGLWRRSLGLGCGCLSWLRRLSFGFRQLRHLRFGGLSPWHRRLSLGGLTFNWLRASSTSALPVSCVQPCQVWRPLAGSALAASPSSFLPTSFGTGLRPVL